MTTLSKLIIASILGLLMSSCKFDINLNSIIGNGDVTTENRKINGDFDAIKVSRGLDVYITQSANESITVEADDNLHDIIMTEVENNVLKIYADENISYSKSKKVMVSFKNISKITATSGSDVISTNVIKSDELELLTSSGSNMKIEIETNSAICESASGSDLSVSGKTNTLYAEASSGSDIKAANLKALETTARASSGADVTVNTAKELTAKASSGGDIKYYGDPEKVDTNNGVSGSVRKQ